MVGLASSHRPFGRWSLILLRRKTRATHRETGAEQAEELAEGE